jgi:uncharacterized protein (DUF1800 family)
MSDQTYQTLGANMRDDFGRKVEAAVQAAGLDTQAAAEAVLNRMAFGPRPSEAEHLASGGVVKWIEAQLDADLPETMLETRLADIPAGYLGAIETMYRYPDLGKVYAHARHAYDLIPPRGAPQDFGWVKRKIDKFRLEQGYLDQDEVLYAELMGQKILRAVFAANQLREVLTDFWFNHFYVSFTKYSARAWILAYERDAIRPNVFGSFRTLLGATAHHPAMLFYLDNNQSVARAGVPTTYEIEIERLREQHGEAAARIIPAIEAELQAIEDEEQLILDKEFRPRAGINENYARELMELHTLGVNGGYNQIDVSEVARALTGWTVHPVGCTPEWFERGFDVAREAKFYRNEAFLFRPDWHDAAEKRVLGHTLPAGRGMEDGEDVLDILAGHGSTAQFLARKLAERFVEDQPSGEVVGAVTEAFLESGGDLRQVIKTLLSLPQFWIAAARKTRIKSPIFYAASAVRAIDAWLGGTKSLAEWIARMGQPLYGFKAPTGFPDRGVFWINAGAMLNRMSFAVSLANNKIGGIGPPSHIAGWEGRSAGIRIGGPEFQQH